MLDIAEVLEPTWAVVAVHLLTTLAGFHSGVARVSRSAVRRIFALAVLPHAGLCREALAWLGVVGELAEEGCEMINEGILSVCLAAQPSLDPADTITRAKARICTRTRTRTRMSSRTHTNTGTNTHT
jgi:hypothetical protein